MRLSRLTKLKIAYAMLREVRIHVKEANAPKTLRRVRLTISSIKGAIRNAGHDKYRAERRDGS